ncbi:MAG TPA: class II fructose-bisphosphate aldolase [Candidatus Gallacutalibacter stercoravium]|nr:class II fructose-bisphosphate aldolase [Candidatus Gallacutalibacter stercoravium]
MPLVSVKKILTDAWKNGYGVAAINVYNYETIRWAVKAAEEEKMPLIVQFYPGYHNFFPMEVASAVAKLLIKDTTVPIGLHQDHSNTFELAISGIRYGFPSIMIDKSLFDFEENASVTAEVVKCAHAMGVEVEGELGHVGSADNIDDFKNPNNFTSVEEAVAFVERTHVDSLAVSVGNGHGAYVATPQLDFERIKQLRAALDIPLVMHGCSDIPTDQLQKTVELGFSKYNIATEYDRAFYQVLSKHMKEDGKNAHSPNLEAMEEEMIAFVRSKMQILNPNHVTL